MLKNRNKTINLISLKLIIILAFLGFFLFLNNSIINVRAQTSPDAIAIRVIPNPNHYSALRWYREQEFSGSPQTLMVDGYEAVRDGRTVYVDVANIASGNLYTNIYLISYNQSAERDTVDIFGRILDHWKFNTNITSPGFCRDESDLFCLIDEDCPIGDFCDSPKARIIRDTGRLADLAELKTQLDKYNDNIGKYPTLSAGTYLPNRSLSVWPSWRNTLSSDLGTTISGDPVNKIGPCPANFNESTCWDEVAKSFVEVLPNIPDNSLLYTYSGDSLGASYDLCTVFESGLNIAGVNYVSGICPSVCLDFDGDGYGNPGNTSCTSGSILADCNDTDITVTFGTSEAAACANGLDDDCDGFVDCNDIDCLGACSVPLPTCGNSVCNAGECLSCPSDCVVADCCGIEAGCQPLAGENSLTCPGDCPGVCGNSNCEAGECDLCAGDCAVLDCCGDLTCQTAVGENSVNCGTDCICTDGDGDNWYLESAGCNAEPGFAGHNDCDDTRGNVYPTHAEVCDGLDNNCSDPDHTIVNTADIDETLSEEACDWVCNNNGFTWVGIMGAPLNCCGNDALEAGPFQSPEANCSDNQDNDCNGLRDNLAAPQGPDPNCAGTCFGASTGEHFYYVFSEDPDCNQCDFDGDNDSDQSPSAGALDWLLTYPGMSDMCDPDCVPFGATIDPASPAVHIDKYEAGAETRCDGLDNNCNGTTDEGCDNDGDGYCDSGMFMYDNNSACTNTVYTGPADDGNLGDDCVDSEITVHPGAAEICGDGYGNDCTGVDVLCAPVCTDDDGDLYILESTSAAACGNVCGPANNQPCSGNNDCDDGPGGFWINPGGTETCDGLDNDCSDPDHTIIDPLQVDNGCDDDGDGYCDNSMQIYNTNAMCTNTTYVGPADDGKFGDDCDDGNLAIFPSNPEICDGLDNDCSDPDHTVIDPMEVDNMSVELCQYACETIGGFTWSGNGANLNCCGNDALEAGPYQAVEIDCSDNQDNDCNGLRDTLAAPFGPDPNCGSSCSFLFTFPCTFP